VEIKFRIDVENFEIVEATSFNCTTQAKREIKNHSDEETVRFYIFDKIFIL
jgi:hypothetical protein